MTGDLDFEGWICPVPLRDTPTIVMGHGGGGAMSAELVEHLFLPGVRRAPRAPTLGDSAVRRRRRRPAGVLDRLVRGQADVLPRRLDRRPGGQRHGQRPGDVRRARRCTCRPRSSSRRAPRWPTSAGSPRRWARPPRPPGCGSSPATPRWSTAAAATACTSTPPGSAWSPTASTSARSAPRPGDAVLVSGDIGVHGIAVMSCREGLEFGTDGRAATPRRCTAWSRRCSPPAPTCTCCATRPAAGWPRRSTRSPRPSGVGVELVERDLPVPADGARRVQPARPRPAARGERGQAARDRRPPTTPTRCWRRCGRTRSGAARAVIGTCVRRASRHGGGQDRRSAAPGWSTCRSASSCRGSADARAMPRARLLFARYAYPPNELGSISTSGLSRWIRSRHSGTSKSTYGSRSILFTTTRSAARNMYGYFSGLSVALGDRDDHHLGALAEVEQRRADQVADVLDEHQRAVRRVELGQRRAHHLGVEVTAGAGVDLDHRAAGAADPLGVERGLLVALDDRDRAPRRQVADGALQQRGLAGAGRAHQVEREDPRSASQARLSRGERVVLGQHVLLEHDRSRAGVRVRMRVRVRWS